MRFVETCERHNHNLKNERMFKSAVHQRLLSRGVKVSPYELNPPPLTRTQQIQQNKRPLELHPEPARRLKFQKQQSDE